MWQDYELPITCEFGDIRTDWRVILDIFAALNDNTLTEQEKIIASLEIFYIDFLNITDISKACELMILFINGNQIEENVNHKPLMNWQQDLQIIIPPVNRVLGFDVRDIEYLHWWKFLSAFVEIGECTFNTFVAIRDKRTKGKKLEKYEQEIYKNNRSKIDLKSEIDVINKFTLDGYMKCD